MSALTASMRILESAQDVATVAVGVLLVLLAAVLLGDGAYQFVRQLGSVSTLAAANNLLDRALLVLNLIEIVHTVVLSLRAHTLLPQPPWSSSGGAEARRVSGMSERDA